MRHFLEAGCTLQEVGDAWGVSRERVRQLTGGAVPREAVDPVRLLRAARKARGITEAATEARCTIDNAKRCLSELGAWPALTRLWSWRQRANVWTRDKLVARMRELGAELGRAPTAAELNRAGPTISVWQRVFGSLSAANEAAGFEPRPQGQRPDPEAFSRSMSARMTKTHCKYGHPLAGDNLYFNRGHRFCRACMRRRKSASKKRRKGAA